MHEAITRAEINSANDSMRFDIQESTYAGHDRSKKLIDISNQFETTNKKIELNSGYKSHTTNQLKSSPVGT